jgi:hypothetical protein
MNMKSKMDLVLGKQITIMFFKSQITNSAVKCSELLTINIQYLLIQTYL